jgi:hypothetical protein
MELLKELFEMAKAREFSSGFMKDKKSTKLATEFKRGKGTFELSDGRVFKGAGVIGPVNLKKGDIVLASYNKYNQGAQLYEILGVTKGDSDSGSNDQIPFFNSVKEALDHYGVDSLEEMDEEAEGSVRLVVKDLEDGDSGAWFYIFEDSWVRGSGAEPLTFTYAREIQPGDEPVKKKK